MNNIPTMLYEEEESDVFYKVIFINQYIHVTESSIIQI